MSIQLLFSSRQAIVYLIFIPSHQLFESDSRGFRSLGVKGVLGVLGVLGALGVLGILGVLGVLGLG